MSKPIIKEFNSLTDSEVKFLQRLVNNKGHASGRCTYSSYFTCEGCAVYELNADPDKSPPRDYDCLSKEALAIAKEILDINITNNILLGEE